MNINQLKQRFTQITGYQATSRNFYISIGRSSQYDKVIARAIDIYRNEYKIPFSKEFDLRTRAAWEAYVTALEEYVGE